jgi:molybdopterin molybdotransferase
MITVEEAKRLLFAEVEKSKITEVAAHAAFGYVLAEDVLSPVDLPLFNQSSMDGYAVATNGASNQRQFKIIGEIKAGEDAVFNLQAGQAVRIFTGAAIPSSADAIAIQEKVNVNKGDITLTEEVRQGAFMRLRGSQIKKGELALKKDSALNPASIGFLAAIGITKVKVYSKPDVSILVTGDEIILPGNKLEGGQIYESNSFSLHAALQQMRIKPKNMLMSKDDKEGLKKRIEECLINSDIVLITGGVSVGKYDFVKDALSELNFKPIFYKVAQKPGKPILIAKRDDKLIFALPGNPASVLVCFYEYAYPAIRMMQGIENAALPSVRLKLAKEIVKNEERAFFMRAKRTGDSVMPLDKQDSAMLQSFAVADALIYVPIEREKINKGEEVEVHLLPFAI